MQFEPSETFNPIASMLRTRVLSAPPRPGVLAQLDRFEILEVLHQSKTTILFLARDIQDHTRVALKILRPEFAANDKHRQAFESAAAVMQLMRHPGILEIKAVSEPSARAAFYAMPYLPEGSLTRRLEQGSALTTFHI